MPRVADSVQLLLKIEHASLQLHRFEVRRFVAELVQANSAMLNLAKRLGKIEIKTENGAYHVTSVFA